MLFASHWWTNGSNWRWLEQPSIERMVGWLHQASRSVQPRDQWETYAACGNSQDGGIYWRQSVSIWKTHRQAMFVLILCLIKKYTASTMLTRTSQVQCLLVHHKYNAYSYITSTMLTCAPQVQCLLIHALQVQCLLVHHNNNAYLCTTSTTHSCTTPQVQCLLMYQKYNAYSCTTSTMNAFSCTTSRMPSRASCLWHLSWFCFHFYIVLVVHFRSCFMGVHSSKMS